MNATTEGQASPNSHFFHVARLRDGRYHAKEVHGEEREAFFDNKQKAIQQVDDWIRQSEFQGNSHLYIHDEHGKIREEENI